MTRPVQLAAAAVLCIAAALPARAGRPLQTDDAGVLERGACELEAHTARESALGATARALVVQAGCGVGAATQLALAVSRTRVEGERGRGVELSGKTSLWQGVGAETGDAPALTLAYALSWVRSGDLVWRHGSSALNLVHTRMLTPDLALHANLGHARDDIAARAATRWGVAIEAAALGRVAPMAEVFGDDRTAPWWNLGARFNAVTDRFFIDASHGRQMVSGRPRLTTLGLKAVF